MQKSIEQIRLADCLTELANDVRLISLAVEALDANEDAELVAAKAREVAGAIRAASREL